MAKKQTSQPSNQTDSGFGIQQASYTNSIAPILGAALFGVTNANNLDALAKLANESKKVKGGSLAVIGKIFDKDFISTIKENLTSINTNITDINTNIKSTVETLKDISDNIDFDAIVGIGSILVNSSEKLDVLHTDLNNLNNVLTDNILKEIKNITPLDSKTENNIVGQQQTLNIVVTGVNNESLDLVKQLAEVKLDADSLLSAESIDKLIEVYKKIDELFKLQVSVEANGNAAAQANTSIQSNLDKIAESAVTAKQKQKDIEEADASLEAIMNFVIGASFVLIIGAAVMMIPGMVEASLNFAGVLAVFITAILTPILLLQFVQKLLSSKFIKDKNGNEIPENISLLNGFVAACGFTMMIGALFMLIPGMVENALKFAAILTLFIVGVSLAIRLLPKDAAIMGNLKQFASLITTCSFVMMFGALFMMLGGGKLVKHALLFGVTLGLFILSVLGPVILFSKLFGSATVHLEGFNKIIIVAAFTMLIGGAFMMLGGGKYVKYALQFGAVLGLFIAMVIAPTLLINIFGKEATDAIKRLTILVIVSTVVLMIGAYFMTTDMPIFALAFTLLLTVFITAILLPLMLFRLLSEPALKSIKHLTVLILVSTICLLIGSYFMQDKTRVLGALAFTALMAAFMFAIVGPLLLFKTKITQSIPIAYSLALLVVACTASLTIGAWAMKEFGALNIIGFGIILAGFITVMGGVIILLGKLEKHIIQGILTAKLLATAITALSFALAATTLAVMLGGGPVNTLANAGTLLAVTGIFALLFGILGIPTLFAAVGLGTLVATGIGVAITLLGVAIGAMNVAFLIGGGIDKTMDNAIAMLKLIGLWSLLFTAVSPIAALATLGAIAGTAIGIAITSLSVGIGAMNVAFLIGGGVENTEENANAMIEIVTSWGVLFALAALLIVPATLGAIAGSAIAIAITALSVAIGAMNVAFLIGGGADNTEANGKAMKEIVKSWGELFKSLSSLVIPATLGISAAAVITIAVTALSIPIGLLSALFLIMDSKTLLENITNLIPAVEKLSDLFLSVAGVGITAALALLALSPVLPATLGISTMITAIGVAGKVYNSAGKIDIEGIKKTIKDFFTITDVMPGPVESGILGIKLLGLRVLVGQINGIVHVLSDSVANVAHLKIATNWNSNGIATDYRYLTTEDFVKAALHIKFVFTTLFNAIKDTYDDNQELFNNDFYSILYKIRSLTTTEGYILSTLSNSLQSYANLLIPKKWNKDGDPIAFRTMTKEDFTAAAEGIEKVLTTMATAIETTYTEHKDTLFGDDFRKILKNVTLLSVAEGEILSTLSEGLQSYTQLLIPTKWNNKGKAIAYRKMTDTDFINAGKNIGAVMITMASAIHSAWTGGDFTVITANGTVTYKGTGKGLQELNSGGWFGTSVSDIIKELQPMGDLISSIAQGLHAYSQLLIPIDWDNKGRPIKFKQMSHGDILLANSNICIILTGLATAIKDAYDSMDSFWGDSVETMLSAFMPMGDLISSIAQGIADYAELKFPIYDANGKITGYNKLIDKDFIDAGKNIGKVLTGVSESINKAYENMPNGSADTIKNIIEAFVPIGDLISNLSEGIAAYANAKIPTGFDREGKPTGYTKIDDTLITNCSNNIKLILFATLFGNGDAKNATNATGGIIGAYNILKELKMHKKIDDILESLMPVSEFISSMTDTISSFSKMQFPNAWDENGKPTSYVTISGDDITKASGNIMKVIFTTLFGDIELSKITDKNSVTGGVIGAYNALQKINLDDDIQEILESMMPVGELIGNMANGVSKFATLQIPIKWDPQSGNAIDYMKLSKDDFTKAGDNIKTVITTIFKAIPDIYTGNEHLFDTEDQNAPIAIVMDSVSKLGNAIKDIAEGVQTFANGGIPKFDDKGKIVGYTMFDETTAFNAALTIGIIMTTLSVAVCTVYETQIKPKMGDTGEFAEAIAAIGGIGGAVKNISDGVQAYAELKIPTGWDKDGKPIGYKKLPEDFVEKSKKNIASIITSLSEALILAWNGYKDNNKTIKGIKEIFEGNTLQSIIITVTDVNTVISIVGTMVAAIGEMKVADGFGPDGKATGYSKLGDADLTNLYSKITDLLVGLPQSVYNAYNNNKIYFDNTEYISKVLTSLPLLHALVEEITNIVNIIGKTDLSKIFKSNKRVTKNTAGKIIDFQVGAFKDIYIVTDEISTIMQKLVSIPAISKQLNTIDESFSVLSSRIYELSEAINDYYENKAFEENINRVSRFVSETVNTLDVEKIDHLIALIESMNRLSDKTTTLDSLTNAIANNLSVVLKQLGDKMEEAKATIKITEQMQAKRHKLINDSIAKVKEIMSNEIIVTVNTSNNESTSSTRSGSSSTGAASNSNGSSGSGQTLNIGTGTGADTSASPASNIMGNMQQSTKSNGNSNQIGNGNNNSQVNTQTSTINDMSEKINTIYNIIKERF